MTKNWNEKPERAAEGLAFMQELNTLLRKHRVAILEANGPVLTLKFDVSGGDYCGFCGPQPNGKWIISAPWGWMILTE